MQPGNTAKTAHLAGRSLDLGRRALRRLLADDTS